MKFLEFNFIVKFTFWVLFFSLIPIGEIYLILYLNTLIGTNLLFILLLSIGLFGAVLTIYSSVSTLKDISLKIKNGEFPKNELQNLAGGVSAGLLLMIPGFITSAIGLLCYIPVFRSLLGKLTIFLTGDRIREIYEYTKLLDIDV